MTEETVKEFIKSYSELKARRDVIDKIRKYSDDENRHKEGDDFDKEYSQLDIKIQIIESALEILPRDEKEIIFLHLIDDIKWREVKLIYEKQFGTELTYSERTFARMQKNALKKIEEFLLKNKLEQYIN